MRVKVKCNSFNSGCNLIFWLFVINVTMGAYCFQYCLWSIFGKDIPWYADIVAGFFGGQFCIPLTIICWIIRLCGVEAPFITR